MRERGGRDWNESENENESERVIVSMKEVRVRLKSVWETRRCLVIGTKMVMMINGIHL